jgi:hypothetical protein
MPMPPHAPTHLIADYVIEKATADLYEPLLSFLTVYACINVATVYVTTGAARCQLGDYGSLSDQFPLQVQHPTGGLISEGDLNLGFGRASLGKLPRRVRI